MITVLTTHGCFVGHFKKLAIVLEEAVRREEGGFFWCLRFIELIPIWKSRAT